jgi:protocatechuate 3,4-dioxygenase beta subunit
VVAVLATLLVVGGIPGARLHSLFWEPIAPPLPEDVGHRNAVLDVWVRAAETKNPVAGARVRVLTVVDDRVYFAGSGSAGADGHAAIGGIPPGEQWVLTEAEGFARASSHVVLAGLPDGAPPETRRVDVELGPEHIADIAVRDEAGAAIAGAAVEVTGADPMPVGARTGPDGNARVGRLGPSPWMVAARAEGYEEATQRGVREGEPVVLTLRRLGALVVTVVGDDQGPVQGAKVDIAGATLWPARTATTDDSGQVRIGALSAGSYAVRARKDERVSATELGIVIAKAEEKAITLELRPGRMVTARVVDGEGDDAGPIAGANVTLAEHGLSPFPLEGRTDREGRVRLGPIATSEATLSARADGYVARGGVPVPAQGDARVVLTRAGVLVGRVVDTRGFPVDGATIEIVGTDFQWAPIADDPRRAQFREAHFEAMLSGPAPLIPTGELGVVPGPVPPIPRAFGGSPFAFDTPAPTPRATGLAEPWVTRDDGTYRASPATPGRIRAVARHPEYVEGWSEPVTLAAGAEATADIVLRAGGLLEGRVVDSTDRPVPGAHVTVAATRGAFERATVTASDGTFAFASVPEDVLVSVASADDPTEVAARVPATIPERGRKEITLKLPEPRLPLPVRVRDDRGYPLGSVQVTATSLEPGVPLRATAFTDARGEAALKGARGVSLRVEAFAPGHAPARVTVEPSASELTLSLAAAEKATGEVLSSRGDPVEGADVVLYTELGARHARTDAEGAFTIAELAPGPAQVRVRAAGFAPTARAITIPSGGGDRPYAIPRIELASGGTLEGVVVDGRGDPVQGARVAQDRVPTYLAVGATPAGIAVTDAKGRFSLADLPEGSVTLEAYAPELGRVRVEGVRVIAGRPSESVRIVLLQTKDDTPEPATSGGVAVTLGETSGEREVVVVAVAEGSEAERAGLLPGDIVVDVDGVRVQTIEEARARLSGPAGDDVVLRLRRGEKTETVRVSRERVRR